MRNTRFTLPRRYWVYIIICGVLGILLFVNIFSTDALTGEKDFCDFTQRDWRNFALFLLTEVILIILMAFFSIKAGNLNIRREEQVTNCFDQFKYAGAKPGDCDYIWFDFSGNQRAKIIKLGDVYYLYVESFDHRTELWSPVNSVSVFNSLIKIKEVLFYEFDFFCEENTALDRHGDERFRDEH